jgi:hypothetical protein
MTSLSCFPPRALALCRRSYWSQLSKNPYEKKCSEEISYDLIPRARWAGRRLSDPGKLVIGCPRDRQRSRGCDEIAPGCAICRHIHALRRNGPDSYATVERNTEGGDTKRRSAPGNARRRDGSPATPRLPRPGCHCRPRWPGGAGFDDFHCRATDHRETCPFISSEPRSRRTHLADSTCESPVKVLGCPLKGGRATDAAAP